MHINNPPGKIRLSKEEHTEIDRLSGRGETYLHVYPVHMAPFLFTLILEAEKVNEPVNLTAYTFREREYQREEQKRRQAVLSTMDEQISTFLGDQIVSGVVEYLKQQID